jgi:hypothetical protein
MPQLITIARHKFHFRFIYSPFTIFIDIAIFRYDIIFSDITVAFDFQLSDISPGQLIFSLILIRHFAVSPFRRHIGYITDTIDADISH